MSVRSEQREWADFIVYKAVFLRSVFASEGKLVNIQSFGFIPFL